MEKDFDGWNIIKKSLNDRNEVHLFKQGEVWWCMVGVNVANESCGKGTKFGRPVLILKKLSNDNFVGIPLSTKEKSGSWFTDINLQGQSVRALLYQIRMFSSNRLQRRLTTLDRADFARVKEKLEALLELSRELSPRPKPGISGLPQK